MGVIKDSFAILIGGLTSWIYPKCKQCGKVIVEWEQSISYKKMIFHKKCLLEFKREVYK